MCDVRPFCGLRYSLQRVPEPSVLIAPPYDIISIEQRALLHSRSPYNVVRLEYGLDQAGDSETGNKYTRAAATLAEWLRDGVLVGDEQPSLYIVEHSFERYGIARSRWGLICRVRLAEYGSGQVRPHEHTTREPAVDRLNLLRACRASFSPVMGLVRSENGELVALWRDLCVRPPEMTATDDDSVTYNLWTIREGTAIDEVRDLLANRTVYIADGHHRYETALRYRNEQLDANPSASQDEPFNFVMMSLMDAQDPGLLMLPTHRMAAGLDPAKVASLEDSISPYFRAEDLLPPLPGRPETIEGWLRSMEDGRRQGVLLGLYGSHGRNLRLLRLRPDADLSALMTPDEIKLWKNSDVFILQKIVLGLGLGIDTLEKEVHHLRFTRDAAEAAARVDAGEFQMAFFLNPAPVSSMLDASDAGRKLPQKSTYFHPKTPAGLVINPVCDR